MDERGPDPGSIPIPRHPDAARIIRAYKLRQQPAETPGEWTARGSFMWRAKWFFSTARFCRSVCRTSHTAGK